MRLFLFLILIITTEFNVAKANDGSYQYVLGTGDTINILVFEEDDMSFDIKIDETGLFTYPYMGDIQLIGKTTNQLEQELVSGLKTRVLINPNISVNIVEYRPFSIGGEVENPGSYPFEPGLNVKKAINIAGGATQWSTGERVTIDRSVHSSDKSGKVDLETPVFPGDVVTVLPRRF